MVCRSFEASTHQDLEAWISQQLCTSLDKSRPLWQFCLVENFGGQGKSALLFWKEDSDNNGRMELREAGLIEHDPETQCITLYMVPANADNGGTMCDCTDIDGQDDISAFKNLQNLRSTVLMRNVPESPLNGRRSPLSSSNSETVMNELESAWAT